MAEESELDPQVRMMAWLRFHNKMDDALGRQLYEWEGMQDFEQEQWLDGFTLCQKLVAEAENASYDALGRKVRTACLRADMDEWEGLPLEEREKWKHMVRCMAILLEMDPEEDGGPEQHEDQLLERFLDKLKEMAPACLPPP